MFLDLINLYNKNINSFRTPLEDFNTESFANLLRLYENIKNDFIYNFLKLPEDKYVVRTQLRKALPKATNCIIDLVLIGENNVCFIENKVESPEGWEQLKRYGNVLDIHYSELKKHLYYFTKYTDLKNEKGEYDIYNFKQFKWFEIAKFLRKYQIENPLIKEYLKFLTNYKMAQDNTFKTENILSMENMLKTVEIIEFHIDNCKDEFNKFFGSDKSVKNYTWNQLKTHNRICNWSLGVLNNGYSEVLYGIELGKLKLRTQIYVSSSNGNYQEFKKLSFDKSIIKTFDFGNGFCYYVNTDLGKFLNDENSDKKIKEWFLNSFEIMKTLISNNPELDWR